ncbi:MAG: hypothetical protein HYZ28_18785 [Myxococcales bacterium]|nr:hypothetical protein [Myxococcales bacterium]
MRHAGKWLALASAGLALAGGRSFAQADQAGTQPTAEQAQPAPAAQPPEQQPMARQPMAQAPPPAFGYGAPFVAMHQGLSSGIITGLNYANGVIWLSTGPTVVAIRATPAQMATLQPGQVATLPYASFAGVPWLVTPAMQVPAGFSQQGTFSGVVTGLNKATGLVAVHGQVFQAHPSTIQHLLPGQFVSLTYARVQEVPWVQEVSGAPGAPVQ